MIANPSALPTGLDTPNTTFDDAVIGMAYVAADGGLLKVNRELCRLVGYSETELLAIGWEVLTHPADLAEDVVQARRLLSGEIESYELEKRYFHKRGDIVWARMTASRVRNSDPPIFLGQVQNISDRRRAARALLAANERLARLLENLHAGILVEDERRMILLTNSALCRIVEIPVPPPLLVGRTGESIDAHLTGIVDEPRDFNRRVADILAHRTEIRSEWLELADGRTLERDYVPIITEGENRGHMWIYRDVTVRVEAQRLNEEQTRRLREANDRLAALAATDALTGLPNRRSLQERLFESLEQSVELSQPVSLVLLDVDRFKEFNDAFGHPAGDEVLRALAGLLRHVSRLGDVPARFGGEEFAILLPNTDVTGAHALAERCRRVIERAAWPLRPVTASFGVATLMPPMAQEESAGHTLFAAADAAMYRSKALGRNRVTHAEELAVVHSDSREQ